MPEKPKELICVISGSRTWPEVKVGPIELMMVGLVKTSAIPVRFFVGDCPSGVDAIALQVADKHDLDIHIFVADWEKHGRAAGPIRNGEMVSRKPHLWYAFRNNGDSPGTDDGIRQALEAGVPTYIVRNANEQVLQASVTVRPQGRSR